MSAIPLIHDRYREALAYYRDELKASQSVIVGLQRHHPAFLALLERLAKKTRFSRRRYGSIRIQWYTWAKHPLLPILDPWPATIFPKNYLLTELAIAFLEQKYLLNHCDDCIRRRTEVVQREGQDVIAQILADAGDPGYVPASTTSRPPTEVS